ncbi:SMP-30/gluconolactonase/LRE family protein [Paraglaciecola sp. L3A3]|uniref:SMP-30/gluconolactonase/LRE family protein n=1 Tax=Paraglaciecola sp. L3A3 TaxID=2686358 RepID=UPI00131B1EC4|nr:SMP-30/gluconolactonase/LRE family protein [Paraglaciecola sp. L3A3]
MSNLKLEYKSLCRIGEGVLWVSAEQAVYWTDILGNTLYKKCQDSIQTWHFARGLTSIGINQQGGLVGTFVDGLYILDLQNEQHKKISSPQLDYQTIRFNDGAVDSLGNYWAGTMHMDDPCNNPVGQLYRFSALGDWSIEDNQYHVPNGPCFSADGKFMYHTDTLVRQQIYRCQLDNKGHLQSCTLFIHFAQDHVYPDGMCLDVEGNLWVALWGGWAIQQYSPRGALLQEIRLPVSQVTKCVFGGVNMDTLYITTASEYLSPNDLSKQPLAGSLFSYKTQTQGYKEQKFTADHKP